MRATLTRKGQVTLPAPIRAALKLDAGARLDFTLQDDGSIRVVPVSRDPLAVGTVLPKPPRAAVSDADIRAAIAARAIRRTSDEGDLLIHPLPVSRGEALLEAVSGFDDDFVAALEAGRDEQPPPQEREAL